MLAIIGLALIAIGVALFVLAIASAATELPSSVEHGRLR
jgi:multisubunit Na+/H+ antiporter MnhC subunit